MILASIDIGSNAIRLQIVKVFEEDEITSFKKLQFLRFPLRLGTDVFDHGQITDTTKEKFLILMSTFKNLMDLYEIDGYMAVATSAMREATNGKQVVSYIHKTIGLDIKIISGNTEASIINKAMTPYLTEGYHLHIDVGGGSTELNFYDKSKLITNKSFKIGSVRKLSKAKRNAAFGQIKGWIKQLNWDQSKPITSIGTGGNINKLFKIANKQSNTISLAELKAVRAYVKAFTPEDRISILKMNPDRSDVIIPASKIYIKTMKYIGSDTIIVPKVGLKDGLIYELYEQISKKDLSQIAFI